MNAASAVVTQNSASWYWTSDTDISSVAIGDVDGDGQQEIVTGGSYHDGIRYNAQLVVWSASDLSVEQVISWYWTSDTDISSVAIGDVDGDGQQEIVTGGSYHDGVRHNAQLCVWSGTSLALERIMGWYWTSDTQISSVSLANISKSVGLSIVTGGSYHDGIRYNAQLCVWSGTSLALERIMGWYWTSDTQINSVATGDLNGNGQISIITGGSYFDGNRYNAQLCTWDGASLALNGIKSWYWTSDTEVSSVAVGNLTGGSTLSIIAGGSYCDGVHFNSQLSIWDTSLSLQDVKSWYVTSDTKISSVAVGNFTGGDNLDIITAGAFDDGSKLNAQLINWDSETLAVNSQTTWFEISDTTINSVVIGNTGSGNNVISGALFYDNTRNVAQISIWGY